MLHGKKDWVLRDSELGLMDSELGLSCCSCCCCCLLLFGAGAAAAAYCKPQGSETGTRVQKEPQLEVTQEW